MTASADNIVGTVVMDRDSRVGTVVKVTESTVGTVAVVSIFIAFGDILVNISVGYCFLFFPTMTGEFGACTELGRGFVGHKIK